MSRMTKEEQIREAKERLTEVLDIYCDKWEVNIKYKLPDEGDTEIDNKHNWNREEL